MGHRGWCWRPGWGAALLWMLAAGVATAEPLIRAPVKLSLVVMLKVLTYDQSLPSRGKGDFVVAVLYGREQKQLAKQTLQEARELEQTTLTGRPLRYVAVDATFPGLSTELREKGVSAVLFLPELSTLGLQSGADAARELNVYSLTLEPSHVEKWAALGVSLQDSRPKILVNLPLTRALGATFDASLLNVARVFR